MSCCSGCSHKAANKSSNPASQARDKKAQLAKRQRMVKA